jgi:glycosyltransferase involved in cell wall biosynthesis
MSVLLHEIEPRAPFFVPDQPLRILHVFRAPVGGLFRHVLDLSRSQVAAGHQVGIICDSTTGSVSGDLALATLASKLEFGITRIPMQRNPHWTDIKALRQTLDLFGQVRPHVIHGHGSKGGFYARVPALFGSEPAAIRAYTPHGGSFNYRPGTLLHRLYMRVEAACAHVTDIVLFESQYVAQRFERDVGKPRHLARVIVNGIGEAELQPVVPRKDAADFVFLGSLTYIKGIDILLEALAVVSRGRAIPPRLVIFGAGDKRDELEVQVQSLGLQHQVSFRGMAPAREALTHGRIMVVPSRAESLPYVVLEGSGGRLPLIATDCGGTREVFGPYSDRLIPPGHVRPLAEAMAAMLDRSEEERRRDAEMLGSRVAENFSLERMNDSVLSGYRDALSLKYVHTC